MKAIFLIAILGIIITGYLTYVHITHTQPFCPLGGEGTCGSVLQSSYATMFHVPVALLGFLIWSLIGYFAWKNKEKEIMVLSLIGVVAAGYFNGVMYFSLQAFCFWCEASHALMVVTFFLVSSNFISILLKGAFAAALFSIPFVYAGIESQHEAGATIAQCLAAKEVTMYGASWCPHCAEQKALFGKSFVHVPYVECADPVNPRRQTEACREAYIESYPTWIRPDGARLKGVQQLTGLAGWAGC